MFLIQYWLLPSLVMFLCLIRTWRINGSIPEDFDDEDWVVILSGSIVWPIGILSYFVVSFIPILIKERKI